MTNADPIRTPASLWIQATCPSCGTIEGIALGLTTELLTTDDGAELRVKARTKGLTHLCGQLPLALAPAAMDAEDAANRLVGSIAQSGTTVTITAREQEALGEAARRKRHDDSSCVLPRGHKGDCEPIAPGDER